MDLTKGKIEIVKKEKNYKPISIVSPPDFIVPTTPEPTPHILGQRTIYRQTIEEEESKKRNLFEQLRRDSTKLRYYMYKK